MNKNFFGIALILLSFIFILPCAASERLGLSSVNSDLQNRASLQRGAKIFMNYCSGCHSLRYLRYNRLAKDLGLINIPGVIDQSLLRNNLIFTSAKINDPIEIAMPAVDARKWFGVVPPDLSLSAREQGAEVIYNYLKSFYADNSRPFGANNIIRPDVAMPNIFFPLQGLVIPITKHPTGLVDLKQVEEGELTELQFDSTLEDLVNFLVYAAEPAKLERYHLGWWVLGFISLLLIFVYQLKRIYWTRL